MIAPVPMVSTRQIAAIHALRKAAGLADDDLYRGFLNTQAGVRSSRLLTAADAVRVIDALKELAGQTRGRTPPPQPSPASGGGSRAERGGWLARGSVAGLDTPAAKKLRALWIAAYDLGLVRDRTDRAMLSFLERQTGVSHTRFLAGPGAAAPAIEALKSWLARAGKVAWPSPSPSSLPGLTRQSMRPGSKDGSPDLGAARRPGDDEGKTGAEQLFAHKRAVLDAQWLRLVAIGAVKPIIACRPLDDLDQYAFKVAWKQGWCFFEGRDYDQVQAALGRKLRAALARLREAKDGGAG